MLDWRKLKAFRDRQLSTPISIPAYFESPQATLDGEEQGTGSSNQSATHEESARAKSFLGNS